MRPSKAVSHFQMSSACIWISRNQADASRNAIAKSVFHTNCPESSQRRPGRNRQTPFPYGLPGIKTAQAGAQSPNPSFIRIARKQGDAGRGLTAKSYIRMSCPETSRRRPGSNLQILHSDELPGIKPICARVQPPILAAGGLAAQVADGLIRL